jgi:hypothetical protein
MQSVVFTAVFERHAKDAGLSDDELMAIATRLAENPLAGDLIPGTGGARKTRFARDGKGKSGGYRTIHYFGGGDIPVFLLALVDKGKRADLSQAERNALSKLLTGIGAAYRESSAANIKPT